MAPRPMQTESLMGYVLRLTEVNGYPTCSYVLASMHGHWYRAAVGRLDATPLGQIAGLTADAVARLTMCPELKPLAYIRVHGNDLPSYEVSMRAPKVCPQCLAEAGHCEAFWDLAQAVACPVHRVMLISRCSCCESNLSWVRHKVRECRCGADLRQFQAQPADAALCDLMGVMRHLLYRDENIAPCPSGMQHLAHLDVRRLCKLLWVLSSTLRLRQGEDVMPKSRHRYMPQLKRIAVAFQNWPVGFQALLEDMYELELATTQERLAFHSLFGWLFVRLIKNDHGDGSLFAFLERETYRYGAKHWTRGAMTRKNGLADVLPDTMRWGTIGEAAQILDLHMATMKKLIAAGKIKTRTVSEKSKRSLVVDLDWARSQKISRYPPVSIRAAAKHISVSIETLRAMRENGVYKADHRPGHRGSLSKEDVDVLRARLHGLVRGKKSSKEGNAVTLDSVFKYWKAGPGEKAAFFACLLENPSRVIGRFRRTSGVRQAQVSGAMVEAFFKAARQASVVTSLASAKRLKCTAAVITGLKRLGHLECARHKGRLVVTELSLRRFEQTYEAMSSVANRMGVSVRRVCLRLDFQAFQHIRVVLPSHTTIFIHADQVPSAERCMAAMRC